MVPPFGGNDSCIQLRGRKLETAAYNVKETPGSLTTF
jgi:hypothetical protein